jgi:hypothetical protein
MQFVRVKLLPRNLCSFHLLILLFFWCFSATFCNIAAKSWRPDLVVEEVEVPERTTDNGQATGKLHHLAASRVHPFL